MARFGVPLRLSLGLQLLKHKCGIQARCFRLPCGAFTRPHPFGAGLRRSVRCCVHDHPTKGHFHVKRARFCCGSCRNARERGGASDGLRGAPATGSTVMRRSFLAAIQVAAVVALGACEDSPDEGSQDGSIDRPSPDAPVDAVAFDSAPVLGDTLVPDAHMPTADGASPDNRPTPQEAGTDADPPDASLTIGNGLERISCDMFAHGLRDKSKAVCARSPSPVPLDVSLCFENAPEGDEMDVISCVMRESCQPHRRPEIGFEWRDVPTGLCCGNTGFRAVPAHRPYCIEGLERTYFIATPAVNYADTDSDLRYDLVDNCPITPNFLQLDTDGDDKGDACDTM